MVSFVFLLISFQNGVHAPHMLGNQLNPNSNMAQKMTDHLNSEMEAHSIFNPAESSTSNLVGPQLHSRVIASVILIIMIRMLFCFWKYDKLFSFRCVQVILTQIPTVAQADSHLCWRAAVVAPSRKHLINYWKDSGNKVHSFLWSKHNILIVS